MTNVIVYLIATIGTAVQTYHAMTGNLWWSPRDPYPTIGFAGVIIMALGTAWSAVKGTSAAWIVFFGSVLCWAFYLPALNHLIGNARELVLEGRLSFNSPDLYLTLLPPALLAVATAVSLVSGPMAQKGDE